MVLDRCLQRHQHGTHKHITQLPQLQQLMHHLQVQQPLVHQTRRIWLLLLRVVTAVLLLRWQLLLLQATFAATAASRQAARSSSCAPFQHQQLWHLHSCMQSSPQQPQPLQYSRHTWLLLGCHHLAQAAVVLLQL
jgi:hypothetical protein